MIGKFTSVWCGALLLCATTLWAQDEPPTQQSDPPFEGFSGFEDPLGAPGMDIPGPKATFSASFLVTKGAQEGVLSVSSEIQPGWHIYSITQPPDGPLPTVLRVADSEDYDVGSFEADRDPIFTTDPGHPGVTIEEHEGEVVWQAPLQLASGVDPAELQIEITINGQVCQTGGSCNLIQDEPVVASFAGYLPAKSKSTQYADPSGHLVIEGSVAPKVAAPGDTVKLALTVKLDADWHVYRYAPKDKKTGTKPTLIVLRKVAGWQYGTRAVSEAQKEETGLESMPVLYYHEESVTWTVPIEVPKDAEPGDYSVSGSIAYQPCTSTACEQPTGADFEVTIQVGSSSAAGKTPLTFAKADYESIAKIAEEIANRPTKSKASSSENAELPWLESLPLAGVLTIAFLAGLILNVMPCVLPVIGLKVMSFVHQAGGSRGEILALNLWFSLGLMSVFWILGAAAAFAGHTWGQHFGDMRFLIAMISIVFAFGLSFLGVWELPIPGFVGSGGMSKAAQREGATGAFTKGVLSTILATPCAGPLIGPAVGWAVKQPPTLTFAAFTFIGLGMAAPYLLIGAVPRLVSALPKPGPWMDTFKQVMGFILMGTVVFLFMSVPAEYVIPTLVLLLGIAVGCWLIGVVEATETINKVLTWSASLAIVTVFALFGFLVIASSDGLEWKPFSRVAIEQELEKGNTVMVDFTANW